jgi:hypothetical protein
LTGRLVVGGLKLATAGHDDSTLKLDPSQSPGFFNLSEIEERLRGSNKLGQI